MDGDALVTMAEQWTNVPPQKICRTREDNKQRYYTRLLYIYSILSFQHLIIFTF